MYRIVCTFLALHLRWNANLRFRHISAIPDRYSLFPLSHPIRGISVNVLARDHLLKLYSGKSFVQS